MSKHPVETLRNIVFVGHGAVGKTTLADHILFKAGLNNRAGSVDDGTSLLDTDEDEIQHHYSITSHLCHFEHQGQYLNLVDAPGYPDFIAHAISAMGAVETAVIEISAAAGIEVNTRKTFQLAGEHGLARMIVINKCDTENIQFDLLLERIRNTFGPSCCLINVPNALGASCSGVISTVAPPAEIPASCPVDVRAVSQRLLEAAVETDEALMEKYFETGELSPGEMAQALQKAVASGALIPILCTVAKKDIGVVELMDALALYAPSPMCLPRSAQRNGASITIKADADGPVVAQVFKTRIDPFISKMSFVRIYSGTVKKDDTLRNERTGKNFKVTQILKMQGHDQAALTEASAGDLIVVTKIEDLKTSDTITRGADGTVLFPLHYPTPMIGLAVEPKSQADQQKISGALHKVEEEDPTFHVTRESQTHEMVMHGMSELHLSMIKNRLHNRDKVDVVTHLPRIPYHETVNGDAEGSYRHKKQSGGSGQFAEVHLRISHCPQGIDPVDYFTAHRFPGLRRFHYDPKLNFAFIDRVTGGSVPNQFIPAVQKGVRERLDMGVLAGCQVQDVVIELFFGKDHPVDSNETAFKTAARMCFKEVFMQAKPSLLEPIVNLEVTIPQSKLGDITSDLNSRRGRMEGMDTLEDGTTIVKAKVPLAEVMTYARSLSSMTGGQGAFTFEISHYEPVPGHEQQKIMAASQHQVEELV